ncbi:DNA polymerase [Ruminococcus sp. 5_1_39BFAA]|uniref:DNA polymerase n=1 Tax=Ruminococcus sp. 5_1_39BFAA TaxID=457412 RepID=UPI00356256D0
MKETLVDIETYSEVDIKSCGLYRYATDPSFEILLIAWATDDGSGFGETQCCDLATGDPFPAELLEAFQSGTVRLIAHNASFERVCFSVHLQRHFPGQYLQPGAFLSPENWLCTMVMAGSLTLPLALKDVGEVLKTAQQKDKEGERLIKLFSMPCKPTKSNGYRTRNLPQHYPADWAKFKGYCIQDVNTEIDIYKRLKRFPMPDREWHHYRVNERVNDRGVKIDTELVQQAIACDLMLSDAMTKKAYELTGLENPNSVSQLKSWLDERGIPMDSLGKKDVAQMIGELDKNGVDEEAMDMLKLRLQMAKSSVKKYQAAERCVCPDGRARGLFQFYGASRTGRYSGRNIQLQNLPQNHISTLEQARELVKMGCFDMVESIYGNTPDVLSQLIRTMLVPKEGCEFIVADFSAIEARVLAWEAEEQWVLDAFENGEDLYCATASQMFHVPVVKHGVNGELRQKGKIATLACGYGGSSGALISMGALQMGLKEEELPEIIDSWREANPKIVQYWWDVEKAAMTAYKTGERSEIGKIAFEFWSGTLWMVLPSGRRLVYLKPRTQPNRFGRMSLTYEGVGQNHKWSRQETYSGRLVENATQAIARDILAEAMARMEDYGLSIVGHVHDEVIIEAPIGKYKVDEVCKLMAIKPDWCEGLPLSAAGYLAPSYYFKD